MRGGWTAGSYRVKRLKAEGVILARMYVCSLARLDTMHACMPAAATAAATDDDSSSDDDDSHDSGGRKATRGAQTPTGSTALQARDGRHVRADQIIFRHVGMRRRSVEKATMQIVVV